MKRDRKMKQGNGSDLLDANDPRNATIGMIYVGPTDDRESVLAAILTQEKLGRKQIAIVLPNQNKAFQRPVDFDGLKNMRHKLQAQLVIIAPQDSGPADFARQRRFTYFTSLENYAKSLREESEAAKATRGGIWLFGGRHAKQVAATAGVVGSAGAAGLASDAEAPIPANASHSNGQAPQRNRRKQLALALLVLLVFSILLCGGIAVAAPSTWQSFTSSFSHVLPGISPTATVTITPKSVLLQNTYAITALTSGTPDSAKREVGARQLTFITQSQTKTVSATGFVNTPATHATGTLTFVNGSFAPYGVTANTVFTDAQGVQVANDVLAYIPAANPNGGFGRVTVSAHAITAGSRGNIRAFDFNNVVCCANNSVLVSNTVAFSGGQDPQKYTVVKQSDIDNAAAPFKQPLLQSATSAINGMPHANEQFVGTPKCTANVTSNHKAGDAATSVTVHVTATCTGVVYDLVGAENIATNLLKAESEHDTGGGYALAGKVVTTVTQKIANNNGAVVFVKTQGVWVAQIDDARKAQLASLITGRTQNQASTALLEQRDVAKVDSITVSSGNTLPTNARQITIVVKNVPGLQGLQGTPTTNAGVGTATPTNTLTSPVVKPSPNVTPGK